MAINTAHWVYQAFIARGLAGGTVSQGKAAILALGIPGLDSDKLNTIIDAQGKQSAIPAIYDADYAALTAEDSADLDDLNTFIRGSH